MNRNNICIVESHVYGGICGGNLAVVKTNLVENPIYGGKTN